LLGLYIHFPFCRSRCPYCDFATDARGDVPHEAWADAVVAELDLRAPLFGAPLSTIYFGGGTPGLWRPDCVAHVVRHACARFGTAPDTLEEVTLEANPGDADLAHYTALREAGVGRLSLGVQSLSDRFLRVLGRRHDARQAREAMALARRAGIDNVSCDLMFALPEQTMADVRADLDALIELGPDHVSAYTLTVEPATPFGALRRAGRLVQPDAERQADMFECVRDTLESAGFLHYEISNWGRPGRQAIHNTRYWTGADYLGLGASAHSRRQVGEALERWGTVASPDAYLDAVARVRAGKGAFPRDPLVAYFERLDAEAARRERVWLALRTSEGAARELFEPQSDPLRGLLLAGLVEEDGARVRLSRRGVLLADEVAVRLM
jgi:putative oxygen-independent coproporphyrinogen III oxidase